MYVSFLVHCQLLCPGWHCRHLFVTISSPECMGIVIDDMSLANGRLRPLTVGYLWPILKQEIKIIILNRCRRNHHPFIMSTTKDEMSFFRPGNADSELELLLVE